jgi:hypothetical protein
MGTFFPTFPFFCNVRTIPAFGDGLDLAAAGCVGWGRQAGLSGFVAQQASWSAARLSETSGGGKLNRNRR